MSKGIIAGIIVASAIFAGTAFAGERTIKVEGRKTVWAEKQASAPHALTGRVEAKEKSEQGSDVRAFGRSGYARR